MKNIVYFFIIIIITASFMIIPEFLSKNQPSLPSEINKIVTLSPAHTKTLDYLNLGDKIVGISVFDSDPKYQDRAKIGGGILINEEAILKLSPDLTTIGDIQNADESIKYLNAQGICTLTMYTRSFQDIYNSLIDIQNLFPDIDLSDPINNFKQQWDYFRENPVPKRKKILMIIGLDPIYTIAQNTYINEVLQYIGWDNVIQSSSPYPILSEEDLKKIDSVDMIIAGKDFKKELKALKQIQHFVHAKEIFFFENDNYRLPSPYLIELISDLRHTNQGN